MDDVAKLRFSPVGKCIYCGRTDKLSDEHIIPYGLGGRSVLPKSSCSACAKVTGKFEQDVLRGPLRPVRIWYELQSRTKHKDAPATKPIDVLTSDGASRRVDVGFADSPLVCAFPIFALPALLDPKGYTSGVRVNELHSYAFGPTPEQTTREMGAQSISWTEKLNLPSFARMLAKICYAGCVAQGGLAMFEGEPTVAPSILGRNDDIGRWVGTVPVPPKKHEAHLHRVTYRQDPRDGFVRSEIQLFAEAGLPVYAVIVGRTRRWIHIS